MALIEGILLIALGVFVSLYLRRRQQQKYRLAILHESKGLVEMLMLDRDLACEVHTQLGQALQDPLSLPAKTSATQ